VLGLGTRLFFNRHAPLWFDETFTGVIASQPDLSGLWNWLRGELTGPLFYAPIWLWARLAGTSDVALRLPSLILSLAVPAMILWRGHPNRDIRLLWACASLLWLPAPILSTDARPYSLLTFEATAQGIAFVAAMRRTTTPRMLIWTAITTAMGLTHYWALLIGLVQGLILVGTRPRRALATWPALAPFAVLIAWMAMHLPMVLRFTAGYVGTSYTIPWFSIVSLPGVLAGTPLFAGIALAAMLWTLVERLRTGRGGLGRGGFGRRGFGGALTLNPSPEAWLGISGVVAVLLFFVIGVYRPGFATRYLLPSCPALLFGFAVWARWALRFNAPAVTAAFCAMIVGAIGLVGSSIGAQEPDQRHSFNLERPSEWLMQQPVRELVFVWTDPDAERSDPGRIAQVARFFFDRAGRTVSVRQVIVPSHTDASARVLARAGHSPGTAILWLANTPHLDDALRNPEIARDPRWECRDFGNGLAISTACRLRQASTTSVRIASSSSAPAPVTRNRSGVATIRPRSDNR
jgi:uncharacterized protein YndB with AHSA1/START domain